MPGSLKCDCGVPGKEERIPEKLYPCVVVRSALCAGCQGVQHPPAGRRQHRRVLEGGRRNVGAGCLLGVERLIRDHSVIGWRANHILKVWKRQDLEWHGTTLDLPTLLSPLQPWPHL
jgi:hypothetical protein